ncbi:MAG: 4Fe-4S binding protein [Proteobacteria bacterium]|nr:4Fe-4S binding protein [Pseudomonadota bacterium]
MGTEKKGTFFKVDPDLCVGCGNCVDACPMKILALENGLCIITDISRCLECGTCVRECAVDAITIEGVHKKARAKGARTQAAAPTEGGGAYTPILKTLQAMLEEIIPTEQMFAYGGVDITVLNDFELEGKKCFYRAYIADKLEKIGISSMNFYGSMTADVLIITPGREYDIPYFVMDWDESEDHIFFICDLMPSDDLGRNMKHLNSYFHGPLEELYQTYSTIPGLHGSVFHWVRAIHSPYLLCGTVEKNPRTNVDMLFHCAVDYLKAWLKLWEAAQPGNPEDASMQLIHERRKNIRALYREFDPGVGSLNKFLGDTVADISLSIIEP